jgi:alpha-glucosidase (family GH31 glycosyl hydrolase)
MMQMSTFSPVFRPHGSGIPSEPIFFSPEPQKIVKDFIRLRYSFLPYNYSLAYQNSTQGIPMARPVFYQQKQPENDLQTWSYSGTFDIGFAC